MPATDLGPELSGLTMTRAARSVLELAARGGTRPHLGRDGARPDRHGRVLVYLNAPGPAGLFGGIYLSARTGKIIRAYLTPGNWAIERCYVGARQVRPVLAWWDALMRDGAR